MQHFGKDWSTGCGPAMNAEDNDGGYSRLAQPLVTPSGTGCLGSHWQVAVTGSHSTCTSFGLHDSSQGEPRYMPFSGIKRNKNKQNEIYFILDYPVNLMIKFFIYPNQFELFGCSFGF